MEEMLSAVRLCIALAFMAAASVMDWRTRKVSNRVWITLGAMGIAILAIHMLHAETGSSFSPAHFLIFVPVIILFMEPYREWAWEVKGLDIITGIMLLVAGAFVLVLFRVEGVTSETVMLATIPGTMLFFMLLYYLRVIHGGADAKAMMALAIVLPFYPAIGSLPLIAFPQESADMIRMAYPFSLLILMNAAILHVAIYPLLNVFRNLRNGDVAFPEMFMGYRMDLAHVPKSFVWPMEVVRDGEVVLLLSPKRSHDVNSELEKLREKGIGRIWVQRKAPFIISMTMGLVLSIVVGNVVMLLFMRLL